MDIKFQDRIDDYLFDRMSDADREAFLQEVKADEEKTELLEFTKKVKDSICSREEKLRALVQFQQQYEEERRAVVMRATDTERVACYCPASSVVAEPVRSKKKMWLWISGVAAVFIAGFFVIRPMFMYESSPNFSTKTMEQMRGGDGVFSSASADSIDNDTVKTNKENNVAPNE